ncbi:MAG: transposase, partial [Lactobacillus amylovorus]|nr:transposase [Lactobacillus amylovorus]
TPSPPFNHSYISSSILVAIIANKFDLDVPFNRQERMWQVANLELDSKQMANAAIKGAKRFLKPLSDYLVNRYYTLSR